MTETGAARPTLIDGSPETTSTAPEGEPSDPAGRPFGTVYLRPAASVGPRRRLSWLARVMGLEHYSAALMTRKVRVELPILAAMLVATFFFELIAWSFLFNGIFVGDMYSLDGFGTTAALSLGLLFALVVLFFERQVITADTWRMDRKDRRRAQRTRVLTIAAAGFIVAHAVDLLAFRVPVERLLHEEAVYDEAQRLSRELDRMMVNIVEEQSAAVQDALKTVTANLESAHDRRVQAVADQERYRQERDLLRAQAREQRQAITTAEEWVERVEATENRAATRGDLDRARNRYSSTSSQLQVAVGDHGAATAKLDAIDRQIEELTQEQQTLREAQAEFLSQAKSVRQARATLETRRERWVEELLRPGPGYREETGQALAGFTSEEKALWPVRWRGPLVFLVSEPDFFEQIHAIYRMAFGWFGDLNRLFRGDSGIPDPSFSAPRTLGWSLTYFFSWLAIHLAAIFVPFLVFAVKWLLMPKEVDAFFSTWHQAFAGDPDARMMLAVEEKVRTRGERW